MANNKKEGEQTMNSVVAQITKAITSRYVAVSNNDADGVRRADEDLISLLGPIVPATIDELAEDAYQCDCGRFASPRYSSNGVCWACWVKGDR